MSPVNKEVLTPMQRFGKFFRKNWLVILGMTLSVATILTFFLLTDGLTVLKQIYRTLRYKWLVLAFALVAAQWLFDAAGLQVLVRQHDARRRFFPALITTMVGVLYSAITPSSSGGQPMQVISLNRQGMDTATATSVILVKTVLYQVSITLIALAMVVFELPFFQSNVSGFSFIVLFAMFLSILFISGLLLFMINQNLTRKIGHGCVRMLHKLKLCRDEQRLHEKLELQFEQFFISARTMGNSWARCILVVILTLLQLICFFSVPYCIYRSFGFYGASVLRLFAAATFVYFASMFVPVPGASGGAEGSFFLFFASFFTSGTIAPAMLLWRLMTYYGAIVVGCIFIALDRKRNRPPVAQTIPNPPDTPAAEG